MSWKIGLVFKTLRISAQPPEKQLQAPVFYLRNSSRHTSLLLSQIPEHFQPVDYLDPVQVPQFGFCCYLTPRLAIQSWISALALALILMQGKAWLPGFSLVPSTPLPPLLPSSQALAPHSPDQCSCLSVSYFRSIKGAPLLIKITYRILSLSASAGSLL